MWAPIFAVARHFQFVQIIHAFHQRCNRRIKAERANGSYEFIANEEYYGRKPVAKRVLFVPVSDPLLAFENGEIDITNVPVDLMDKYKKNDKIGMIEKTNDKDRRAHV